jgi:hypothetical protein
MMETAAISPHKNQAAAIAKPPSTTQITFKMNAMFRPSPAKSRMFAPAQS